MPTRHDKQLVEHAASAHGIATASDLADYFRLKNAQALPAIRELVEEGVLQPVMTVDPRVEGRLPHTCTGTPASRAGSRRPPCCPRSTPWCGSAARPNGSSASTTASRSTPRSPRGCSDTTCCRCSSTTAWWGASTSRATGRTASCGCRLRGARRLRPAALPRRHCRAPRPAAAADRRWQGLDEVEVMDRGRPRRSGCRRTRGFSYSRLSFDSRFDTLAARALDLRDPKPASG